MRGRTMKSFKKEMFFAVVVFVLGIFMMSNSALAQDDSQATLKGKVTDSSSQQALTEIEVSVKALDIKTETDMEGYYSFDELTSGTYLVSVETEGYKKWEKEVTVKEGDNTLDINLDPKPMEGTK